MPTLQLKALNKQRIAHIMHIEMENIITKGVCVWGGGGGGGGAGGGEEKQQQQHNVDINKGSSTTGIKIRMFIVPVQVYKEIYSYGAQWQIEQAID